MVKRNEDGTVTQGRSFLASTLMVAALLLAACSGGDDLVVDGNPESQASGSDFILETDAGQDVEPNLQQEEVSPPPEPIGNDASGETNEPDATGSSSTTSSSSTSTPSTTTEIDLGTIPVAAAFNDPTDVPGSVESLIDGLGVITSPGDPLNVRSAPDVASDVVGQLDHQTTGIISTHIVDGEQQEWRFIEVEGEPAGWVAARFLLRDTDISFCEAPAEMPIGLVGHSPLAVDIDADNIDDAVAVFREELGGGAVRLWVRADLSRGGVVAGPIDEFNNLPASPELLVQFVTNSDALNFNSQFVLEIADRSQLDERTILVLEGCDIEVTTLNGAPFTFTVGELVGTDYRTGCVYGRENRFVTLQTSETTRTIDEFVLNGTQWTFAERTIAGRDPITEDFPIPDGFTFCLGG